MARRPATYRAYLLRVWTQEGEDRARASIRDVKSGETRAFRDLDHLDQWLHQEVRTNRLRSDHEQVPHNPRPVDDGSEAPCRP